MEYSFRVPPILLYLKYKFQLHHLFSLNMSCRVSVRLHHAVRGKNDFTVYVGNLPHLATENDLRALFFQAGTVMSLMLIKDRER
jgi:hypothetical protein